MDLNSLLVLPDDVLCDILSYMSLKTRVKHSRTCSRMLGVVNNSLRDVKDLSDMHVSDRHADGQLKTLSKLTNLRVFNQSLTTLTRPDRWLEVLINKCHKIEQLTDWDVEHMDSYVSGLQGKGLPIKLKVIDPHFWYTRTDESPDALLRLLRKVDTGLGVSNEKMFNIVVQHPDLMTRVLHMNRLFVWGGEQESDVWRKLVMMPMLRTLKVQIDGPQELELLLNSLPHLTYIEVNISNKNMMPLLISAKQEFTGLRLTEEDGPEEEDGDNDDDENNRSQEVDFHHLEQVLRKHGPRLKDLTLELREVRADRDVIELLSTTCPRLKQANVSHRHPDEGYIELSVLYLHGDRLIVETNIRGQSLQPLFRLFPKFRSIEIGEDSYPDSGTLESWITELRDFANARKKYRLDVDVMLRTGESSESLEGNMRLSKQKAFHECDPMDFVEFRYHDYDDDYDNIQLYFSDDDDYDHL